MMLSAFIYIYILANEDLCLRALKARNNLGSGIVWNQAPPPAPKNVATENVSHLLHLSENLQRLCKTKTVFESFEDRHNDMFCYDALKVK